MKGFQTMNASLFLHDADIVCNKIKRAIIMTNNTRQGYAKASSNWRVTLFKGVV